MEQNENENHTQITDTGVNRWLIAGFLAMVVIALAAFGYGYRQQILVGHLTAQASVSNSTINDMQGQLNNLTAKLNDVTAAQQAAAAAQSKAAATPAGGAGVKTAAGKRNATENKRLKDLQARIDQQQKLLTDTQDQVAKNRSDLEGNLSSTRDELNGSIARTHEELVALAKRGERSYFEFDLRKSKEFQRVGPLTLSLRKADIKHNNFELQMIVDDNKLTKKNVNLYEPIWIHTENESQPVQVVVNRVQKNVVHGYVSAPKYKSSELNQASPGARTITPVAAHPESPNPDPENPNQPQ
jgi:uncharacterized coiled-coil protein SlyX